jgi:hypothetical protein
MLRMREKFSHIKIILNAHAMKKPKEFHPIIILIGRIHSIQNVFFNLALVNVISGLSLFHDDSGYCPGVKV